MKMDDEKKLGPSNGHDAHDARASGEVGELRTHAVVVKPQQRLLHDPAVPLEEYMYYAARARAEEDDAAAANTTKKPAVSLKAIFVPSAGNTASEWDTTDLNLSDPAVRAAISDEEWTNASRALRTASAAACFYLITTDILGPFVRTSDARVIKGRWDTFKNYLQIQC